MRWWQKGLCIEKDIVTGDLNARHSCSVEKIGDRDVKAAQETLEWHFQDIQLCHAKVNTVIRFGSDCAGHFNRQRDDLVQSSFELDLVTVARKSDVFQRGAGHSARIQVIADITDIGAENACPDVDIEGIGIVE